MTLTRDLSVQTLVAGAMDDRHTAGAEVIDHPVSPAVQLVSAVHASSGHVEGLEERRDVAVVVAELACAGQRF